MTRQLIQVPELVALLDEHVPLSVLDVRWRLQGPSTRADYDEGHLPGAVFVDLERDLSGEPGKQGRHPMPSAAAFEATMRRLGVSSHLPVVCYDLADGTSAARAWWLLRYFGHQDVRVLDGGYAAWLAASAPTTQDGSAALDGSFVASPGGMPLVDAAGAAEVAEAGILLDARAAERFRGEVEPIDPVAGHIPGATSAPSGGNVDADGRFLTSDALQQRFDALGVTPARPAATYCGSGVTASQQVLALELIGIKAALYADSWSGWITDPDRPVETGG